ncbi:MAG: sigma-54-dependent Fis family transcriptional regulator [Phycisphaeraceae bacterium]|nr:sigma-54-dependent Fis family transcriptional regulator [Phycisphaeraceae bacterium]MCW5763280.1 sigma-54-dependent Fis family transcriptional regulator [Phycisphaeraceae bacterium]
MSMRVLVVDDDPIVADSLCEYLSSEGYAALSAYNATEALATLAVAEEHGRDTARGTDPIRIVISDVSLPGMGGMELLREIGRKHPAVVVVMLTGYGTVEAAVESLRLGAVDFLTKPVIDEELKLALERATRQQKLVEENRTLKRRLDGRYALGSIIGMDHRMQRIYELVESVAPSKTTVLMTGESGTGKSLIAGAIHQQSPRRSKPFVEISCGSIPETLLESELFGHVKGAFTGAHADKVGRFLAADGGTIFLDEINSASPGMQLKLLRVLQERRFEPVGTTQTIEVDARVILASNQPLEELVAQGHFRQDLYYRINVVKIELPPLRERVSDIPMLAEHFLQVHAEQLGKTLVGFSDEAMLALRRYSYPGNVRELQNIVERAAVLTRAARIEVSDLPPHVAEGTDQGMLRALTGRSRASADDSDTAWVPMPLLEALKDPERRIILKALEANDWNRQKTAEDLEINRTTLYKKMKALGIEDRDDRRAG